MPSLISGFEHDIFISYRHNDNKSAWVTEFVRALEEELASTIKEQLSIYFDKNPHDGLLETHDVDKSLEGKLKCLIFIPIISQTYCDPKSFAWQHEFVAFNKLAKEDTLGRDIKLSNGNVASRILPVKIHDLDSEDTATIEKEISAKLRSVEFIFRSPGVNRPLTSGDTREENSNKTFYRDQINKVANAVKEIITILKDPKSTPVSNVKAGQVARLPNNNKKYIVASVLFMALAIGYFVYSKYNSIELSETPVNKSIAVLPFVNMSNDPDQEYFSDGLSEELLNLLVKVPDLKVIGRTSSFYFKGKNEDLRTIGDKLGAAYLIEGSVRKAGDNIRITAQLIKAEDGTHLWSETYNRKMADVFEIQDEISSRVVEQLKLKIPGLAKAQTSKNPDAYNLLLQAQYIARQGNAGSYEKQLDLLRQAIALDSTDARFWAALARAVITWDGDYGQRKTQAEEGVQAATKALALDVDLAEAHAALGAIYLDYYWDWTKAKHEFDLAAKLNPSYIQIGLSELNLVLGNFEEWLEEAKSALNSDPLNPWLWRDVGFRLVAMNKFDEAIPYYQKSLELSPHFVAGQVELAALYLRLAKLDQAISLLDKIENRSYNRVLAAYAWAYWLKGDSVRSDAYLQQLMKSDLHPVDNSNAIAQVYARRKQADLAFKWVQIQFDRRHPAMTLLKSGDALKELDDPRYEEFLKKMNLPLD